MTQANGAPSVGVLDTGTVVLLPRITAVDALPDRPCITAVTLAELSVGLLVAVSDEDRARRQAVVQQAEADFEPVPFDAAAARAFARVAGSLRAAGRGGGVRALDLMVAACALSRGLPLHTCTPQDLLGIDGLVVVEVPHPDGPGPRASPP